MAELAGALSGAASGASVGTAISPGLGTIVGGIIGAIAGLFGGGGKKEISYKKLGAMARLQQETQAAAIQQAEAAEAQLIKEKAAADIQVLAKAKETAEAESQNDLINAFGKFTLQTLSFEQSSLEKAQSQAQSQSQIVLVLLIGLGGFFLLKRRRKR